MTDDMIPRAEAEALVAAAYEEAAQHLEGGFDKGSDIRALTPDDARAALDAMLASEKSRTARAYSERTAASVAMAKFALALGFEAGVGKDGNEHWDDEWRVVLYVDIPAGQVSWHIAPDDQWMLDGLPAYTKEWDGTFKSRDGSFIAFDPKLVSDAMLAEAREEGMQAGFLLGFQASAEGWNGEWPHFEPLEDDYWVSVRDKAIAAAIRQRGEGGET